MRIAIIGSGISGLVTTHLLHGEHDITVFEANDYVGGHTNTVEVPLAGKTWAVDTGFIVFNDKTYPNFIKLLERIGQPARASNMSFSVKDERSGLEYSSTLNGLFAQRRNIARASFLLMVRDILRFNRRATRLLTHGDPSLTLGAYLQRERYSRLFVESYLVPMGSAIWSTDPRKMYDFPAQYFVRFFDNHGMLQVIDQPTWRTIVGGSYQYVEKLIRPFADRIRLRTPIERVRRDKDGVEITPRGGEPERFDKVVMATHSDQALRLLDDATEREREILGAIPYQRNEAVLHTDASLLPESRRAWASWNYHLLRESKGAAAVTYNMNILQGLDAPETFCVTLNNTAAIAPARIIRTFEYDHPLFTAEAVAAQLRRSEISGVRHTYYCGAYWRFGFHEDGVRSALAVGRAFGKSL